MTDAGWAAWVLIGGMAVIVFLTRAIFILPGERLRLPGGAERVLRHAPAAALMGIIVPDLVLAQGAMAVSIDNPRLIGGLVAFAIAFGTRSVVLSIAGGMIVFTLVRTLA